MPRKLPWLAADTKLTVKSDAVVESIVKPINRSRIRDLESDEELLTRTPRKEKERADLLSSSPIAPSPERAQPKIEYMRPGMNKDDVWMMVEDEFLQTAKLFTRNLHLAEYQRLKALPPRKNVARPVVSNAQASQETKLRMKADALAKTQKKCLKAISRLSDEDLDEDLDLPVRSSSSGLPSSSASLTTTKKIRAPFLQGAVVSSDLSVDHSKYKRAKQISDFSTPSSPRSISPTKTAGSGMNPSETSAPRLPKSSTARSGLSRAKPRATSKFSFDDFDSPQTQSQRSTQQPSQHISRTAKRKAEIAKKEEEETKRKSLKLDEIPTFLV